MSIESFPFAIVNAVLLVVNLLLLLLLRSTLNKLVKEMANSKPAASDAEGEAPAASPLQETFKQYSTLTLRMADLVFRLVGGAEESRAGNGGAEEARAEEARAEDARAEEARAEDSADDSADDVDDTYPVEDVRDELTSALMTDVMPPQDDP